MTDKQFASKLIFGSAEIPELGEVTKEAALNMEVEIKLQAGTAEIKKEILEKFIKKLESGLREKFPSPEYEIHKIRESVLLFKNSWRTNKEAFKKLIGKQKLKNHEFPLFFLYAIAQDNDRGMFYGIRKGSNPLSNDLKEKLLNVPGIENTKDSTDFFPVIKRYGIYPLKGKTPVQLLLNGNDMVNYFIEEFANFIRQTEDKLDEFIKQYKKEYKLQ